MLTLFTASLFLGQSFGWLFKGTVYAIMGLELLNRKMGYKPGEGVMTPTVDSGFPATAESISWIGRAIALSAQLFPELKPFVEKKFYLTESESAQLITLINPLVSLISLVSKYAANQQKELAEESHKNAQLCADALVTFLDGLPTRRVR